MRSVDTLLELRLWPEATLPTELYTPCHGERKCLRRFEQAGIKSRYTMGLQWYAQHSLVVVVLSPFAFRHDRAKSSRFDQLALVPTFAHWRGLNDALPTVERIDRS
jgi:hypothetical protein